MKKKQRKQANPRIKKSKKLQKPYKKAHTKEALVTATDKRVSETHKLR